jgi:hypothetical protein
MIFFELFVRHDPDHQEHQPKLSNCAALVAEKWNPIFERVKVSLYFCIDSRRQMHVFTTEQADEHDVECMFFHTRQGCLVAAGTCPFKHTPLKDIPFSDDASHQASEISALLMSVDPHGYYMGDWD